MLRSGMVILQRVEHKADAIGSQHGQEIMTAIEAVPRQATLAEYVGAVEPQLGMFKKYL